MVHSACTPTSMRCAESQCFENQEMPPSGSGRAARPFFVFIFFRLYCNSILYDLPSTPLSRLQRVQNIAARSLTRTKKHDHILSCTETFTLACCFESYYLQTHAFHFPFHKCSVFAGLYNNTYDRSAQKMRDSCTVLLLVRGRRL